MKQKRIIVAKRRKREQKTNYKKRIKLLISNKFRLAVRLSNSNTLAQIIQYCEGGDKTLVSAHSGELKKLGWGLPTGNVTAAYLTGLLAGKKAKEKGIKEAILDIGMRNPTKGSRIFACLKGVVDNGVHVPHSNEMLPSEERINGKHISAYKKNESDITKSFEMIKSKIKVK